MKKMNLEEQYYAILKKALKIEDINEAPKKARKSKKKKEEAPVEVLSLNELNK